MQTAAMIVWLTNVRTVSDAAAAQLTTVALPPCAVMRPGLGRVAGGAEGWAQSCTSETAGSGSDTVVRAAPAPTTPRPQIDQVIASERSQTEMPRKDTTHLRSRESFQK